MPVRILFWGWECSPNRGGIGVYMLTMAEAMAAAGHTVQFVTGKTPGAPAEEDARGVRIRRLYGWEALRTRRLAETVCAIAREMSADWIEGADHLGECAPLLAMRRRPPVVIKAHGPQCLWVLQRAQIHDPWQVLTLGGALLKIAPQLAAEWKSLERADALVAPGPAMLAWLRGQGVRLPARHGVVANPVKPAAPARPGDTAARPTLLMVGRLAFMKGLAYVAPILARVAEACPEVCLEIAGADSRARGMGSLKAWLCADLKRHHVLSRVRFLGSLAETELDRAYRRAWALMHPSRWESFGNVIPEAMVRQCSVVASRTGDLPELLAGTGNVAADPRGAAFTEALVRVLTDAEARAQTGRRGREKTLREFRPDTVAARHVEFLAGTRT